jgi:hypothetical protein
MEPEGSLPHSQAPATCPYLQPDQSSPRLPIPLLEDPFWYYSFIFVAVYLYFVKILNVITYVGTGSGSSQLQKVPGARGYNWAILSPGEGGTKYGGLFLSHGVGREADNPTP